MLRDSMSPWATQATDNQRGSAALAPAAVRPCKLGLALALSRPWLGMHRPCITARLPSLWPAMHLPKINLSKTCIKCDRSATCVKHTSHEKWLKQCIKNRSTTNPSNKYQTSVSHNLSQQIRVRIAMQCRFKCQLTCALKAALFSSGI